MTATESLDQGLGAASAWLAVVFLLVLGAAAVMFARSRTGRAFGGRMRQRWAASWLGGVLGVAAPGEGASFAVEVRQSTEADLKTNVMLNLEHELTPCGFIGVLVPRYLTGWVASNMQLAEGIVRAAAEASAVEAVVAVNAARFTRTGSHHADAVREQARKRGSILRIDDVDLYAGEVDEVIMALGQSPKSAIANALRLAGMEGSAEPLTSVSRVASRARSSASAQEVGPVPSMASAATQSARSAGVGSDAGGASRPMGTRSAGPTGSMTFLSPSGVESVEITTVAPISVGRDRSCDLVIVGDLSVSATHLTVRLLHGGECAEIVAEGRTGTWTIDGNGAKKHLKKGTTAIVKLPAIVTLGDALTSTVQIAAT